MIKNINTTTNAINPNKRSLLFLDALRGLAALIVMLGHARWLLWEGFTEYAKHPASYNLFQKILVYAFTFARYGHQCVLLFFLLSGFVIHLKYSNSLSKNKDTKFDFFNYLYRRTKRIYPPFLLAVIITLILDVLGRKLGYSIYFSTTPNKFINRDITFNHDLINFFGNLFFLQTSHIEIWGSNGPSWSLKYEWWFYMLYPIIFILNKKSVLKGCLFIIVLFIFSFLPRFIPFDFIFTILQYLFIWWMGAFLADIYTGRVKIAYSVLSVFIIFIPLSIFFANKITNIFLADFSWALGFFGLLNLCFYIQSIGYEHTWAKKLKWLGDCSYTMYIIHFPILVFINGMVLKTMNNSMPVSQIYFILSAFLLIIISYLLHFITEKPFVKKRVEILDK